MPDAIDTNEIGQTPQSKTQLKHEMTELQTLGVALTGLNTAQLQSLDLPENLFSAIELAKKITSNSAKRRQAQYIGRLMRNINPEPIKAALAGLIYTHQQGTGALHELESWRERLLTEGKIAFTDFINYFPHVDRQHLRHLINAALKETKSNKGTTASRVLFRYLREIHVHRP